MRSFNFVFFFISRTLDPRPDEWKRSVAIFTLPEPRQQHCLISINNTALLVGGKLKSQMISSSIVVVVVVVPFSFTKGCERNGDAVRNIHQISQVVPRSLEIMPEWKEFDARLQHPRTDCGQFQLGKRNLRENENEVFCHFQETFFTLLVETMVKQENRRR